MDYPIWYVIGAIVLFILIYFFDKKFGSSTSTETNQQTNILGSQLEENISGDRYILKQIFQSTIFLLSEIEGKEAAWKKLGDNSKDDSVYIMCLKHKKNLDHIKTLFASNTPLGVYKLILLEIDHFCRKIHESRKDLLDGIVDHKPYDDMFKPDVGWESYFKSVGL